MRAKLLSFFLLLRIKNTIDELNIVCYNILTNKRKRVTTMLNKMINAYNLTSYTHNYIMGYEEDGYIKMSFTNEDALNHLCSLDWTRKAYQSERKLRWKGCTKAHRKYLSQHKTIVLCTVEEFERVYESIKYNRGEVFEKLVTEYYNQIWFKDTVCYKVAGDIIIDNVSYQIKFQGASFCCFSQIADYID